MTDHEPRHLVTVWNPAYRRDALAEHVQCLRACAAASRARAEQVESVGEYDGAYVWWGMVRSMNREGELKPAIIEGLQTIRSQLESTDAETHLYITDYQSLYVADLVDVHLVLEDGPLPESEAAHVPAYYGDDGLTCEAWFKVADVRSLVRLDLPDVILQLRQLTNDRYHDRPVSLYGGMVDLPLLVRERQARRWFDTAERDDVTGGRLWVEWESLTAGGLAELEQTLRDDLLGREAWSRLPGVVRAVLASADKTYRDHRADPGFDFGPVLAGFSKALELILRELLRRALADGPGAARYTRGDRNEQIDLAGGTPGLGALLRALRYERGQSNPTADAVRRTFPQGAALLTEQLPVMLDGFLPVRNEGAHGDVVDLVKARYWRDSLLGVGGDGLLVQLARQLPKPVMP